jgi:SAM-dependent methyltransferase
MKNDVRYIHEVDVHNLNAPKKVVPLLVNMFKPKSVLDVGCGIGTWLSVFKENGIGDILGIDGDYVNRPLLYSHINEQEFKPLDISLPFHLNKKYDLAISLEVAEHLDESSATTFVENLCRHSSVIIFGAAVPGQGGQNHLNEQWPEYWTNIFKSFGYNCYDILRQQIWDDKNVEWWYKQNFFVFSNEKLDDYKPSNSFLSLIHPEHFNQKVKYIQEFHNEIYELKRKLESWENGKGGIKRSLNVFLKSLSNKISKK